jgi:hypothetical protein
MVRNSDGWGSDLEKVEDLFDQLFHRFQDSILLVSYRSPGIPSEATLKSLLEQYKRKVRTTRRNHKYVLSKQGTRNFEVCFVGTDN